MIVTKMNQSRRISQVTGLLLLVQIAEVLGGTRFASHVSVNTPARSFTHGVGDPLPQSGRRSYKPQLQRSTYSNMKRPLPRSFSGYPRVRPAIPFNSEEFRGNSIGIAPLYSSFADISIPLLPPSPYKVDSPDPESLWPEGLFIPPMFNKHNTYRRADSVSQLLSDSTNTDPYLLEGSEAIQAVTRAKKHGLLYFHDIPHIESLLTNQELRKQNNLKPHRIGSIRHTWPYNRP